MGVGFFLLVRALYPLPLSQAIYLTGAFALAGCIGSLSVIAPSGLGVREGVLILSLQTVVPNPVAALAAIVARLWASVPELVLIIIAYVYPGFSSEGSTLRRPDSRGSASLLHSKELAKP